MRESTMEISLVAMLHDKRLSRRLQLDMNALCFHRQNVPRRLQSQCCFCFRKALWCNGLQVQ
jgi:hypothetical protein